MVHGEHAGTRWGGVTDVFASSGRAVDGGVVVGHRVSGTRWRCCGERWPAEGQVLDRGAAATPWRGSVRGSGHWESRPSPLLRSAVSRDLAPVRTIVGCVTSTG